MVLFVMIQRIHLRTVSNVNCALSRESQAFSLFAGVVSTLIISLIMRLCNSLWVSVSEEATGEFGADAGVRAKALQKSLIAQVKGICYTQDIVWATRVGGLEKSCILNKDNNVFVG